MKVHDTAILGAGPAGCGAAVQCRRLDLEPVLLDRTGEAGGLVREARLLENYPGLPVPTPGSDFAAGLQSMLVRNRIEVMMFEAMKISMEGCNFRLEGGGGRLLSRSLILAVGTRPVEFSLQGDDGITVHRSILRLKASPPARAAVIGGGEAALDYSLNLADSGTLVTILVRGSGLRSSGKLKEEVLSREGIRILYNTAPLSASSLGGGVIGIELGTPSGTVLLETDAVLAAVGRKPFLPAAGFGFSHVRGTVSTSLEGFYIVGDASLGSLGQASIAAGQGVLAGMMAHDFLKRG